MLRLLQSNKTTRTTRTRDTHTLQTHALNLLLCPVLYNFPTGYYNLGGNRLQAQKATEKKIISFGLSLCRQLIKKNTGTFPFSKQAAEDTTSDTDKVIGMTTFLLAGAFDLI